MKKLNADNFDEFIKSNDFVLVDMWAEWCTPCKQMLAILESIEQEQSVPGLALGKVNVDDNQEIAKNFGVRGIPTLLIFKSGELSKTLVGSKSKENLLIELSDFII